MAIASLSPKATVQPRGQAPTTCVCGHRGRFRIERRVAGGSTPHSAKCETCGGWQSMSTILCYAAIRQRQERRTMGRAVAITAVVLAGLVATTLVADVLERMGTLRSSPQTIERSA